MCALFGVTNLARIFCEQSGKLHSRMPLGIALNMFSYHCSVKFKWSIITLNT